MFLLLFPLLVIHAEKNTYLSSSLYSSLSSSLHQLRLVTGVLFIFFFPSFISICHARNRCLEFLVSFSPPLRLSSVLRLCREKVLGYENVSLLVLLPFSLIHSCKFRENAWSLFLPFSLPFPLSSPCLH